MKGVRIEGQKNKSVSYEVLFYTFKVSDFRRDEENILIVAFDLCGTTPSPPPLPITHEYG